MKEDIGSKIKDILEWIICIVIALVIAILFRYFIGTPTIVKQPSMYPTLQEDQRLWLSRWNRTTKKMPSRGDIITFEAPSTILLTEPEIKLNAVARYEKEPNTIWGRLTYNVLEINKISYIKRVIGVPGDHIVITDGNVYLNGKLLQEKYLQPGVSTGNGKGNCLDVVVPENSVFVMGDNRSQSTDSRCFGCVPLDKIESKVIIRIWPLGKFGKIDK